VKFGRKRSRQSSNCFQQCPIFSLWRERQALPDAHRRRSSGRPVRVPMAGGHGEAGDERIGAVLRRGTHLREAHPDRRSLRRAVSNITHALYYTKKSSVRHLL
jgi:hypothetical protein